MAPLRWHLANPFSILVDSDAGKWNAGRVEDILPNGPGTIVASDTSGVWLVNRRPDAYPAACLSDEWTFPGVSCLEFGPDGKSQVFVGKTWADVMYAMTFRETPGGLSHVRTTVIDLPQRMYGIIRLLVQKSPRRIIATC